MANLYGTLMSPGGFGTQTRLLSMTMTSPGSLATQTGLVPWLQGDHSLSRGTLLGSVCIYSTDVTKRHLRAIAYSQPLLPTPSALSPPNFHILCSSSPGFFFPPLPVAINYAQLREALGVTRTFLPLKAGTCTRMMTRHVLGRRPEATLAIQGAGRIFIRRLCSNILLWGHTQVGAHCSHRPFAQHFWVVRFPSPAVPGLRILPGQTHPIKLRAVLEFSLL